MLVIDVCKVTGPGLCAGHGFLCRAGFLYRAGFVCREGKMRRKEGVGLRRSPTSISSPDRFPFLSSVRFDFRRLTVGLVDALVDLAIDDMSGRA